MEFKYNDSELLYLMFDGDDIALGILFRKYSYLIHKRLHLFRIAKKNYEDFFQESLMALNDAINTYAEIYGKTFNKYFDLILQRRIINLLRKEQNYYYKVTLVDDFYGQLEEKVAVYAPDIIVNKLDDIESVVYELRFVKKYKASQIANILKCETKKVYNLIYLVKQKMIKDNL